ncbi:type II secretion system minor pseudopilin GspK [Thorsellia anophelis]|uniref:Type II secretion system protein K n=1 Tax=Thorsellia anophelis DSM 18579 TaxID=1123402 RepID=A0A1I0AUW6_9GAMM|nr:type II secretion system minor pseudopilin GspK [Thorsellia anophelis]SES98243.1 general secretion pathway protein K [Thorsellia anophelis DSM 18579]
MKDKRAHNLDSQTVKSSKQSGMALLVVLLLIAVMTTIGVLMSERWFSQLKQTEFQQRSLQAKWYMLGANEVIRGVLWRDLKDDESHTHLGQYWASEINQFPLEEALLKFEIVDAYSCLNLNAVNQTLESSETPTEGIDTYIFDVFVNLFAQSGVDAYESIELVVNLQDWLDSNDEVRPYGSEDTYYSEQNPPYLAANQPLVDMTELRLIKGFTPEVIDKIMPHVCVLPRNNISLNVNTLTADDAKLLSSATLGVWDEGFIEQLIANRPKTGWSDLTDFYKDAGLMNDDPMKAQLDAILVVHSQYFIANLSLQIEESLFTTQSLFYRSKDGVSVINTKIGALSD